MYESINTEEENKDLLYIYLIYITTDERKIHIEKYFTFYDKIYIGNAAFTPLYKNENLANFLFNKNTEKKRVEYSKKRNHC